MNNLFSSKEILKKIPTTRYRGSKRRILPWIYENLLPIKFDTVLDGFGGTGSVSYLFKMMNKEVTYNDILYSNYLIGLSVIENNKYILTKKDLQFLTHKNGFQYPTFIQKTFNDIYYLDDENEWLDTIIHNINMFSELYSGKILQIKQALAFNALFQACLCKRPFNLFHRKNLYIRTADVKRSFYNKKIWERPFVDLFNLYSEEISNKIFSNKRKNRAICRNILEIDESVFDLVYLDPPYISIKKKIHSIDYYNNYHFLEGMVDYKNWINKIDYSKKNKPLIKIEQQWQIETSEQFLDKIFQKFSDSILVMSYGEPGYPPIERIEEILYQYKKNIKVVKRQFNYTLNKSSQNGNQLNEVLIIAQ